MKKLYCLLLFCCMSRWLQAQLIETQPINDTICAGSASSFTCEVSMAADIFQWEHSANNVTWNAIAASDPAYMGESTTTLQISSTAAPGLNTHWYRIIVTDTNPNPEVVDTSNAAQLVVNSVTITNLTFVDPVTCGTSTGSFTLSGLITGTIYEVNYTYENIVQTPVLKTAVNSQVTLTNLSAGTYTSIYVIHQGNDCSSNSVGPIELVDPIPNAPTAMKSDPTTCVPPNGSITFKGLNNNWVYVLNYKRDGSPQMAQTINTNASGSYTLPGLVGGTYSEIKFSYNNNECEAMVSGSINLIPASTAAPTITGDAIVCVGESITYTSSAAIMHTWTVSSHGSIVGGSTGPTATVLWNTSSNMAMVNVAIIAMNGCTNSSSKQIAVFSNPTVSISVTDNSGQPGDNSLCSGDMIQLTANSSGGTMPYTYVWTPGNSILNPFSITSGGTYSVKVTDFNLCSATSPNVIISDTATPPAPGVETPVRYCVGESAVPLTATPVNMGILKWIGYPSAPIPPTNSPGNRVFKVTQTASFCESDTSYINVIVHPLPVLTIKVHDNSGEHNDDNIICSDQQVTLISTGADTYLWQDLTTNDTLIKFPSYSSGNYNYMVTGSKIYDNIKTCSSSKNGQIIVHDNPIADFEVMNFTGTGNFEINRDIQITDESIPGQMRTFREWQWKLDGPSVIVEPADFDSTYNSFIDHFIFKYNEPGLKDIILVVTNDKYCTSENLTSISLLDGEGPNADIDILANEVCQQSTTMLVDNSTPTNSDYDLVSWKLNIDGGHIVLPIQYADSTQISYTQKIDNFQILWTDEGSHQATLVLTQRRKSNGALSMNSDVDQIEVKVLPSVIIEFDKTFYCIGDTAQLRFAGTPGSVIQYRMNNNPPLPQNANTYFKIGLPGATTIQVVETSLNGCLNNIGQSTMIDPRPLPVVNIIQGEADTVCQDQIHSLSLSESSGDMKWQLNGFVVGLNSSMLDIETDSTGIFLYSIVGTTDECSSYDTIVVTVDTPPSPMIIGDLEVCKNQVIKYRSESPEGSITWSELGGADFKSPTNVDSVLVLWSSNGTITLTESVGVCEVSDTASIIVDEFSSSPPYNEVVHLKGGGILLYSNPDRIPNLCYQWYKNGNPIQGETFQGIVIGLDTTHIREYSVEVYYCDDTQRECKQFIGYRSSVVEEESGVFACKIYPNPNDGAFSLDIETPIESDFEITAFDFSGRKIFRTQVHLDVGIQTIPLAIYNVSTGMYLLRVKDKSAGQFVVAKVLIVK